MSVLDRLKHAWDTFRSDDTKPFLKDYSLGYSSSFRPDRVRFTRGNEKSIVTAIYNKIAIDCSTIQLKHVRIDENQRFVEELKTPLNDCLKVEANKDQQSRAFIQDIVMSLFDEGAIAIIPVDTSTSIVNGTFDIYSMRTAKILRWFPDYVEVEAYNDKKGYKETITVPKKSTAIIENPHYAVMNEKNSVLQRLISKLNLLDVIDEQSGSGKLDLIIQLPYIIKTEARRTQADNRRKDIESQLASSKFGIAYTDGSEKITQLNRPVENNLLKQIEYLTSMLYGQLGVNDAILDGSASEEVMLNYMNQAIEPIVAAIALEFSRKFITKTGRTQGQVVKYFNDPFRLVTISKLSEVADKFTRNEIMSPNEIRQVIGMKPSNDPSADELRNRNINEKVPDGSVVPKVDKKVEEPKNSKQESGENQNG